MSGLKLVITAAAEADLDSIVSYIASDNPVAAFEFREEVLASFGRLSHLPNIGHRQSYTDRSDLKDIRILRVSARFRNYLIFYVVRQKELVIIRVLHGARDIPTLLLEDHSER